MNALTARRESAIGIDLRRLAVLFFFVIMVPNVRPAYASEPEGRLIEAARTGNIAAVEPALKRGADLDSRTNMYGDTALTLACKGGHKEVARLLLERGADVDKPAQSKRNALWMAVNYGHSDLAELLVAKGADVDYQDDAGETPLMVAARRGEAAIAGMLLKNGAKIDAESSSGTTALETAIRRYRFNVAKVLIEHGEGKTPKAVQPCVEVLKAVSSGDSKRIEKILQKSSGSNETIVRGCSPLIVAAILDRADLVKEMLDESRKLNITNDEINRP